MNKIKKNPIIFSILLIVSVYSINKIPISNLLFKYGLSDFYSETLENIIINFIALIIILILIRKLEIGLAIKGGNLTTLLFYVPILLIAIIFSGGSLHLSIIETTNNFKLFIYGLEIFTSAFLEEFLFRGLILAILLKYYYRKKYGLLKSILISSLIFGCIHFLNYFNNQDVGIKSVTNQIYATFAFGFMYGAAYLKTKNIIILAIIHSLSNFFAGIVDIENQAIHENIIESNKSGLEIIFSEIIRIIIFGIPILIGLFTISQIKEEEIKEFVE